MAHLTILRTYAERVDPDTLPPTVKLCHSDASVTIFDKYPKAYFHFILIPFIRAPLTAANLRDLRSLLQLPREQVKALLQTIRRDALAAKALIEAEMLEKYGCTWGIQLGFHSVPSLEYVPLPLKHLQHIHLHVISTDFRGEYMRSKKHLNSFHPTLGFFIHLDDVLSWFGPDIEPTWFAMKSNIDKKEHEKLLKEDMTCPGHCDKLFKTMPKVREHLQGVFDSTVKATQKAMEKATSNAPVNVEEAASNAPVEVEAAASNVRVDESGHSEVTAGTKRKHDDPPETTHTDGVNGSSLDAPHPSKKQQTASSSTDLPEDP